MADPQPIRASLERGEGEPNAGTAGDAAALTLLWGTWELWADVATTSSAETTVDGSAAGPSPTEHEQQNWLDRVKSVGLVDSVEGFWGVYDCVLLPSQLPPNASYYFFRKHIAPMWEHEANRRGGKWVINFTAGSPQVAPPAPGGEESAVPMAPVDIAWQKVCLACIGELLPGPEEEICGVTVTRGKPRASTPTSTAFATSEKVGSSGAGTPIAAGGGEWKLCLWTRHAEKRDEQLQIAHFLKDMLELSSSSSTTTPKATTTTPTRSPYQRGSRPDEGPSNLNSKPLLVYMAHRDLMLAKQNYAKGGPMSPPLKPRYAV